MNGEWTAQWQCYFGDRTSCSFTLHSPYMMGGWDNLFVHLYNGTADSLCLLQSNMYRYLMWDGGRPLLLCTLGGTSLGALDYIGAMYWYFMWESDRGQPLLLCTIAWAQAYKLL